MPLGRNAFKDFYCGDCITFMVSNKPYIDLTVTPDLNDYREAENTNIKIYNPSGSLIVDSEMCSVTDRPGWYYYRHCTSCVTCVQGIYRVEVTLSSTITDCFSSGTTGTTGTGTTGTSGDPDTTVCSDRTVDYFRIILPETL